MPPTGDDWQNLSASTLHYEPFIPTADSTADSIDASYAQLMDYPDEADYYALLGLSKDATEADIRSAYRTLTLSFHPDKQPAHLRDVGQRHFERIRDAYDTLVDPQKRTVYDLLGAEGVRREWGHGGSMGKGGEADRVQQLGVRALSPHEFRRWFLRTMKARERRAVNSLVRSRGSLAVGIDASDMISVDEDEGDVYVHIPSIDASSYALGYSFRTPLPIPEGLFGDAEKADEDSPAEEDEESKQDSEEAEGTEMVITTSVAGKLLQLEREVDDPNTGNTYIVQLPRALTATDINVGAAVAHAFGDVASAKGIFRRRPFSLLSNSAVTAKASLLPDLKLEMAVAKSFQLVPGTRPFNVNLNTTFAQSIFETLPVIGLQVTKHISDTKLALCSWSSGTITWPLAIQRLVEPFFGLGMDEDVQVAQPSLLQVAFISLPKRYRTISDEDDEDNDDEEEDETMQERQILKSEAGKAESWTVQMQASQMAGAVSLNYGRNLFSGKAADEAVRSEWNSEGYYPMPPESEARSVRLEVQTTIGLDLSLGWHIRGVRQVGEFTRMGLGIGIQGLQGLVMTVSWNRLGQKIQLPISICPADVVNAEASAIGVVFPWLAYCAVEFGFIRPRERRKRRQMMARRHKQLKKQIPRKRAESAQAIELMTHQVQRRQAREEANGGLVITKAEYGYIPSESKKSRDSGAESQVIDVTIPVAALVDQGQLVIPKKLVNFKILGFHDPAPLRPKKLMIWYRYSGREHFVEAGDSEGIACPMRSHLSA